MQWEKIIGVVVGLLFVWMAYRSLRANPQALSKENLGKSFRSMGILGLALIVFVGFCVLLLRS